jgi:hypothetical protein
MKLNMIAVIRDVNHRFDGKIKHVVGPDCDTMQEEECFDMIVKFMIEVLGVDLAEHELADELEEDEVTVSIDGDHAYCFDEMTGNMYTFYLS